MKTARFTQVVAKSGRPSIHLTWVDPKKDQILKNALALNRVMTVHHVSRGPAKDFGTVGLHRDKSAQILIFPKSLKSFSDRRIVGINYELMADAPADSGGKGTKSPAAPELKPRKKAAAKKLPPIAQFPAAERKPAPAARRTSKSVASAPSKRKPEPVAPPPSPPLTLESLLDEVKRAVRELKAGKDAAAYERLTKVVRRTPADHAD